MKIKAHLANPDIDLPQSQLYRKLKSSGATYISLEAEDIDTTDKEHKALCSSEYRGSDLKQLLLSLYTNRYFNYFAH